MPNGWHRHGRGDDREMDDLEHLLSRSRGSPQIGSPNLPQLQQQSPAPAPEPPLRIPYQPQQQLVGMGSIYRSFFKKDVQVKNDQHEFVSYDMAAVQSFILFNLQTMIVGATKDLSQRQSDADIAVIVEYLNRTLHKYCKAVKDLEYMKQFKEQKGGKDNLFQLKPARKFERDILVRYGLMRDVSPHSKDSPPDLPGIKLDNKIDIEHLDMKWRPLVALGTCAAVITPAIIVLFVTLRYLNLIIIGGFSLVVGTILLFLPGVRTRDAIALTAAYISLLLVVVGTKQPT